MFLTENLFIQLLQQLMNTDFNVSILHIYKV